VYEGKSDGLRAVYPVLNLLPRGVSVESERRSESIFSDSSRSGESVFSESWQQPGSESCGASARSATPGEHIKKSRSLELLPRLCSSGMVI